TVAPDAAALPAPASAVPQWFANRSRSGIGHGLSPASPTIDPHSSAPTPAPYVSFRTVADTVDGRSRSGTPYVWPAPHRAAAMRRQGRGPATDQAGPAGSGCRGRAGDRKSTRLNSSHVKISYVVFFLKKK